MPATALRSNLAKTCFKSAGWTGMTLMRSVSKPKQTEGKRSGITLIFQLREMPPERSCSNLKRWTQFRWQPSTTRLKKLLAKRIPPLTTTHPQWFSTRSFRSRWIRERKRVSLEQVGVGCPVHLSNRCRSTRRTILSESKLRRKWRFSNSLQSTTQRLRWVNQPILPHLCSVESSKEATIQWWPSLKSTHCFRRQRFTSELLKRSVDRHPCNHSTAKARKARTLARPSC